tara:strand:+ start:762 stop:1025 length:264 start_codon:yes stop_codon:yes gene_type:complete
MKYIVGAGIGGLFGLSAPFMMDVQEIEYSNNPRQDVPQLAEDTLPTPIDRSLILPDDYCGYINYESDNPKEQAKECLRRSNMAVPAI